MDGGSIPPISTIGRVARCGGSRDVGAGRDARLMNSTVILVGAWILLAVITVPALVTAAAGVAVTAVVPPLPPVANISVLGRRAMGFLRYSLAIAAVFATSYIGWGMASSYAAATEQSRFDQVTGETMGLIGSAIATAAVVFWMWLSVDLLRLGRRHRRRAVLRLARSAGRLDPAAGRVVAAVGGRLLVSGLWILISFYIAPLAATLIVVMILGSAGVP